MASQDMDWITQGQLSLSSTLCKMPSQPEKLLKKFDLDKELKAQENLDNFYLHLQTLKVCYDVLHIDSFLVPFMVEWLLVTVVFL